MSLDGSAVQVIDEQDPARSVVFRLIDSFANAASTKTQPGLYERIVDRADKIAATFGTSSDAVKDIRELRDERR